VVFRTFGELAEVVYRAPLLRSTQLCIGDGRGEPVIAFRPAGQDQQMAALGIGLAVLGSLQPERELCAENGLHLRRLGRFGEPHDAVEAVVVGDRERVQPEPLRLLQQLFGARDPVEEAEAGVRMQFGIRQGIRIAHDLLRDVRLAMPRRDGTLTAVARGRRATTIAQCALELAPRDGRVAPAHQRLPTLRA
jgi:hypothetical protein